LNILIIYQEHGKIRSELAIVVIVLIMLTNSSNQNNCLSFAIWTGKQVRKKEKKKYRCQKRKQEARPGRETLGFAWLY
jgi:hypothetical protein